MVAHLAHATMLDLLHLPEFDSDNLLDQHRYVLSGLANGKTRDVVADEMGITTDGVAYHLKEIRRRLKTHNIVHSVAKAIRKNLV